MQGLSINFMRHSTFMVMNTGLGWAGLGWDGLLRHHAGCHKGYFVGPWYTFQSYRHSQDRYLGWHVKCASFFDELQLY
jgi:hypothetical protein